MSSPGAAPIDLDPGVASALPPSALLVYIALREADGSRSTSQLARWTALSDKTARRGLRRLQEAGVVEQRRSVGDARRFEYVLVDDGEEPR